MTPSFRRILEILNKHDVECMIVGGVTAVIHGAPMTTFNLENRTTDYTDSPRIIF